MRNNLLLIALSLLTAFTGIGAEQKVVSEQPNIVFIYADDWGWGDLSCHDRSRVELHQVTHDQTESKNVAAENPEAVAHLSKLVTDWKATLPTTPNPDCISAADRNPPAKPAASAPGAKPKVTPEQRARAFERWEFKAGLKAQKNLEARFKRFDRNKDDKLERDEFVNPQF